jgi:hypothetical protein
MIVLLLFVSQHADNMKHHAIYNRKLKSIDGGVGSNHVLYVP